MFRSPFVVLIAALLAVGFLSAAASAALLNVEVRNFSFTPATPTINVGDTVRWVWIEGFHTATSGTNCLPDLLFDAPLDDTHPTFEFTFGSPGSVPYFCTPHCGMEMTGTITVRDPTGAPSSPESIQNSPPFTALPNPVREETELRLQLQRATTGVVRIFDASGRAVALLHEGLLSVGDHRFAWNGKTDAGGIAPSGVYFARVSTAIGEARLTLLLVR